MKNESEPNSTRNAALSIYYSNGCRFLYLLLITLSVTYMAVELYDIRYIRTSIVLKMAESLLNCVCIVDVIVKLCIIGLHNCVRMCVSYFELFVFLLCAGDITVINSSYDMVMAYRYAISMRVFTSVCRILCFVRHYIETQISTVSGAKPFNGTNTLIVTIK
jgi:hypothetical protein